MGVHRGGRMQPHRLADLADRRGVAVLLQVAADELEDLTLALAQVLDEVHPNLSLLGGPRRPLTVCRTHVRDSSAPGGQTQGLASQPNRTGSRRTPFAPGLESHVPQAPVAELVDAQGGGPCGPHGPWGFDSSEA